MKKHTVYATRITVYEVTDVMAEDEAGAIKKLDMWIDDDFEEFIVANKWDLAAEEQEEEE